MSKVASLSNSIVERTSDAEIGPLEASLDLLRRLPPHKVEENVDILSQLLPEKESNALRSIVDIPAKVRICPMTSREYLTCEYNRVGESYRSPWSNQYNPPLLSRDEDKKDDNEDIEDGDSHQATDDGNNDDNNLSSVEPRPSGRLRQLEELANEAFSAYRMLYYDGGISSVYVWEVPPRPEENKNNEEVIVESFMVAVLIKKQIKDSEEDGIKEAAWDSMHVVEVCVKSDATSNNDKATRRAHYKLTTTITMHMDTKNEMPREFLLSGNITRQSEQHITLTTDAVDEHIPPMGEMIEDMESRMRSSLQEIYFGKTLDLINEIRPILPPGYLRHQEDLKSEITGKLGGNMAGLQRVFPIAGIPLRSVGKAKNNDDEPKNEAGVKEGTDTQEQANEQVMDNNESDDKLKQESELYN